MKHGVTGRPELVALGASWGGIDAFRSILGALPDDLPLALALVQHRGREGGDGLRALLQQSSRLPVVEPEDKEPILPGRAYLAPADYHLLVERRAFALSTEPLVNWARPSVDALFESAARAYRERLVAIVLSGSGYDGAQGLARVKALGGLTVVQAPGGAQVRGMPDAALARIEPHHVLPLDAIARLICATCRVAPALSPRA
jgi:two-component system chemotaxis response regulator CheB